VRHLKNGSKEAFYKWKDDVKKAFRHKTELEEKLRYYERRLVGYDAVTYDSIGSGSRKNNVEENLLYTIGKIEKVKSKIRKANNVIREYLEFEEKMKAQERKLLYNLVELNLSVGEIATSMKISRSRVYNIVFEIIGLYIVN